MACTKSTDVDTHRLKDYKRTTKEPRDVKSTRKLLARIKLRKEEREKELTKRRNLSEPNEDLLEDGNNGSDDDSQLMSQGESMDKEEIEQNEDIKQLQQVGLVENYCEEMDGIEEDEDGKGHESEKESLDPHSQEEMEAKAKLLYSENESDLLEPCVYFRKFTQQCGFNISVIVDLNILPRIVQLLSTTKDANLHLESAWIVTNIASGESRFTRMVVDAGGVPPLIQLLSHENIKLIEQAIWALGNIVADGVELRDYVLDHGIVPAILKFHKDLNQLPKSCVNTVSWVISNICRYHPYPDIEKIMQLFGIMKEIVLNKENEEATPDICWALSFLADGGPTVQHVIDSGVCPLLLPHLYQDKRSVVIPIIRLFGNIARGSDARRQTVLDMGVLGHMTHVFVNDKFPESVDLEVMSFLSNVVEGTQQQIQSVIDSGLISQVIKLFLDQGSFRIYEKCCKCVCTILQRGNPDQIRYAVSHNCLDALCDLLHCHVEEVLLNILKALKRVLEVGASEEVNPYTTAIEKANGLDEIERLQCHENMDIYQLCFTIVDQFFREEEEPCGDIDQQHNNNVHTINFII